LIIKVDEQTPVEFKATKKGFEVFLKGIGLPDLGAQAGGESRLKSQFESLADLRMGSLKIAENEFGLKITGAWKFPVGKLRLAEEKMEYFDYREKSGERRTGATGMGMTGPAYVIDFWVKKGLTLDEMTIARTRADRAKTLKAAEDGARERTERRRAIERVKAETQDTSRFCKLPLSEENDIILPFHPVHEEVDFAKWISPSTPDVNYTYYEPKTIAEDARYMRLALELYKQSKFGLVIRALDFLEKDFPATSFKTDSRFLRANTYIKLNLIEDAERLLSELLIAAKDSPASLYSGMYLAGRDMKRAYYIGALEKWIWLSEHHADHRLNWLFHLGAAESYFQLRQTERAVKEYEWIVQNAPEARIRADAALRIGNVYLARFQYDQALGAYFKAIEQFPKEVKSFSYAFINRAEAFYGLGQFELAKEAFEEFLTTYPGNPRGWRAAYRIGEIVARAPMTPATIAESRKWYHETINRFPTSAGAFLSRLRLLPCEDHGGMNFETAKRFFEKDAVQFPIAHEGRLELVMKEYEFLRGIIRVRSMITLGGEPVAVRIGIAEKDKLGIGKGRVLIEALLGGMFRKSILGYLAEGKRYEALKFYQEKSVHIPKDKRLLDSDFILKLSQAAADLHLGSLAVELMGTYKEAKEKAEREKKTVAQRVPYNKEDMDVILETSEEVFAEAKALWIRTMENGVDPTASEETTIREKLAQVQDESPFSFDREILLGVLEDRHGRTENALAHALRAQLLMPDPKEKLHDLRLESWIGRLQARSGNSEVALAFLKGLESLLKTGASQPIFKFTPTEVLGLPAVMTYGEVLVMQGEIQEKRKDWPAAAAAFSRAIELNQGGPRAEYGYANALLAMDRFGENEKKALGILEKLGDPNVGRAPGSTETPQERKERLGKQDFWIQMARERLSNERSRIQLENQAKATEGN